MLAHFPLIIIIKASAVCAECASLRRMLDPINMFVEPTRRTLPQRIASGGRIASYLRPCTELRLAIQPVDYRMSRTGIPAPIILHKPVHYGVAIFRRQVRQILLIRQIHARVASSLSEPRPVQAWSGTSPDIHPYKFHPAPCSNKN